MVKEVFYVGRCVAEKLTPNKDVAIISITENDFANLSLDWKYRLNLQFHDIDLPSIKVNLRDRVKEKYICFNDDHAKQIMDFLTEVEDKVEKIIVHCHAGISRSAAVAKFIAEKYSLYFNHQYSLYNKSVYRICRKVEFKEVWSDFSFVSKPTII